MVMFIAKGFHSDFVGTHQLQIALSRFCSSLNYTDRISIFCLKIRLIRVVNPLGTPQKV